MPQRPRSTPSRPPTSRHTPHPAEPPEPDEFADVFGDEMADGDDGYIEPVSEEIVPLDEDLAAQLQEELAGDAGDYAHDYAEPQAADESGGLDDFNFDEELMEDPLATIVDVVDFQSDQFDTGDAGAFLERAKAAAAAEDAAAEKARAEAHSSELEALDPAEAMRMFEQWNKPKDEPATPAPVPPPVAKTPPPVKPITPVAPKAEPVEEFAAMEMEELFQEDFVDETADPAEFSHFGNANAYQIGIDDEVDDLFSEISGEMPPEGDGDAGGDEFADDMLQTAVDYGDGAGEIAVQMPDLGGEKRGHDTEFNLPNFESLPSPSEVDAKSPVAYVEPPDDDEDAMALAAAAAADFPEMLDIAPPDAPDDDVFGAVPPVEPPDDGLGGDSGSRKIKLPPMPKLGGLTTPAAPPAATQASEPEADPAAMPELDLSPMSTASDSIPGDADIFGADAVANDSEFAFDDSAITADAFGNASESGDALLAPDPPLGEDGGDLGDAENIDELLASIGQDAPLPGDLALMETAELQLVTPEMKATARRLAGDEAAADREDSESLMELPEAAPAAKAGDSQLLPLVTHAADVAASAGAAADANLTPAERAARLRVGEMLEAEGVVTAEDLAAVTAETSPLADALDSAGLISRDELRLLLSRRYRPVKVPLAEIEPAPEALAAVPGALARELSALPLRRAGQVLVVAAVSADDVALVRELRHASRLKVKLVAADAAELSQALESAYAPAPDDAEFDGGFDEETVKDPLHPPTPARMPAPTPLPKPAPLPSPAAQAAPVAVPRPRPASTRQPAVHGAPPSPGTPAPVAASAATPEPRAPELDDELAAALAQLEIAASGQNAVPDGLAGASGPESGAHHQSPARPARPVVSEVISAFKLPPPAASTPPAAAPPPARPLAPPPQPKKAVQPAPPLAKPPLRPASPMPPAAGVPLVSDVNISVFKMPGESAPPGSASSTNAGAAPKKVKAKKGTTRRHVAPPTANAPVPPLPAAPPAASPAPTPLVSDVSIPVLKLPGSPPPSAKGTAARVKPRTPEGSPSSDRLNAISNTSDSERHNVMASIPKPKPTARPGGSRSIGKPPTPGKPMARPSGIDPESNPMFQPDHPGGAEAMDNAGETLMYLNEDQMKEYAAAMEHIAAQTAGDADEDEAPRAQPFTFDQNSSQAQEGENFDEF